MSSATPLPGDYYPSIADAFEYVLKNGGTFTASDKSRVIGNPQPHWNFVEPDARAGLLGRVFRILHNDATYAVDFRKIRLEGDAALSAKYADAIAPLIVADASGYLANEVYLANGGNSSPQLPGAGV